MERVYFFEFEKETVRKCKEDGLFFDVFRRIEADHDVHVFCGLKDHTVIQETLKSYIVFNQLGDIKM